jgi:hypothetical protein
MLRTGGSEMPQAEGPYLQIACFCENVIEDKRGVLSIIGIIDTLTIEMAGPEAPTEMPPVTRQLRLVLALKSGSAQGRYQIKITPELPSGIRLDPVSLTAHMEGAERGTNIIATVPFTFNLEGLYWFIIELDDVVITKIPFRVKYSRSIVGRQPPQTQP